MIYKFTLDVGIYYVKFTSVSIAPMNTVINFNKKGNCHLCGVPGKKLHKRSHIVPDWMYRDMKGSPDEKLLVVDIKKFAEAMERGTNYNPPVSVTTPHDLRWYCKDCEKLFERHDDFAAKFVKDGKIGGGDMLLETVSGEFDSPPFVRVRHPKAWRWRFFILSLVYRFHQSEHHLYKNISLGEKDFMIIRELLLNNTFDNRILDYHMVTFFPQKGIDNTQLHFSSPAYGGHDIETGTFIVIWAVGGIWFVVSNKPLDIDRTGQTDTEGTVHIQIITTEMSTSMFATAFKEQLKKA